MINSTERARQVAAQRRINRVTCVVCGTEFYGTSRAKYCSNRCKQAAKNERNRRIK